MKTKTFFFGSRNIFCTLFLLSSLTVNIQAQQKYTPENWPSYNRTYAGERFSPLNQINKNNVNDLKLISTFDLGVDKAILQTGPIVIDGIMYFTTDTVTYAIDAVSGQLKWQHNRNVVKTGGMGVNRGAAYYDGKIIRGGNDLCVFALDAQSGQLLWETPLDIVPTSGASIPMVPIAWNGMVFIGNAGGDQVGVTGHVYAFDVYTGKQLWRYDVIPEKSTVRNQWMAAGKQLPATGGCFWTSFTLDNDSGILYVPSGNPAPDFDRELRLGDNLHTNCVIALNALTGQMLAYNQVVKDDYHDWDGITTTPVLLTNKERRKM